jgi:hypothetical protein
MKRKNNIGIIVELRLWLFVKKNNIKKVSISTLMNQCIMHE